MIRAERDALVRRVLTRLPPTAPMTRDVYVGSAGIAWMWLALAEAGMGEVMGRSPEAWCATYLEAAFRARPAYGIGFISGDLGPIAVAGALAARSGTLDSFRARHAAALESIITAGRVPTISDELFYGRAGLLYGLLFLRRHGAADFVARELGIAQAILESGRKGAHGQPHLRFFWHGQEYLGAAHGLAGIVWMLLQLEHLDVAGAAEALRRSVDALVARQLPSGNLPAVEEDLREDRLVQWCHGAPGVIGLLATAAHRFGEPAFLEAARRAADVTWERGLLRKGLGLCHGVSGNGYAFLTMWRATGEEVYLHRAAQFALFCASEAGRALHDAPDHPFSLFEGIAGTVCFLTDILRPEGSRFPGFE